MRRVSRIQLAGLLAASSLLTGACSTPGVAVKQTLRVETPGCAPVSCQLSNDQGRWEVASTPGTAMVTTSHVPLTVSCHAEGGGRRTAALPSAVAPPTGAGAVTGGLVGGVAVGTAIGAAALAFIPALGAIAVLGGVGIGAVAGQSMETTQQAMRYPELITVPMDCTSAPAAAAVPGLRFGLAIRGLTMDEARALGVGERGAVLVTGVAPGGRAESIGLRAGDVILSAGILQLGDASDLQEQVRSLPPGTSLDLRVWRDGRVLEVVLVSPQAVP